MMGKPQPFRNPQDEKPSLLQSTTRAIRIQIEQLFCMQQFIKEPPVSFLRRYVSIGFKAVCRLALRSFVFLI